MDNDNDGDDHNDDDDDGGDHNDDNDDDDDVCATQVLRPHPHLRVHWKQACPESDNATTCVNWNLTILPLA